MDSQTLWQSMSGEMGISVSAANFSAWVRPCSIKSINTIDEERLLIEIETPSSYHVRTIEERFYIHIKQAAEKITNKKCEIAFVVGEKKEVVKPSKKTEQNPFHGEEPKLDLFSVPEKVISEGTNLNPRYTFDAYMVGSSNRLAFAAGKSAVDFPGTKHNPLFIYGGVGVGKTHLMHAVGHALVKKGVGKVVCITSEQFTNDLVASFKSKMTDAFKKKYRQVGALLIDDVQFFGGKDSTQEEFFHTFNELTGKSAQIVMTSDRKPQDIVGLEDRLKSRFLGGMMVDIGLPDYEMRLAILKQRALELGAVVDPDAYELMANNFVTNGRELEGTFMQLMNRAESDGKPLSKEIVQQTLGLPANIIKTIKVRPLKVISVVAKYFDFKNKDLLGTSRKADLVAARHIAMFILRDTLGLQQEKIGELMGGRDHTTVIHAVDKIDAELKAENVDIRRKVMAIKQALLT